MSSWWLFKNRNEEPEKESMEFYPIVDKYFGGNETSFKEALAAFYSTGQIGSGLEHLNWPMLVEMHYDDEQYQQKRIMGAIKRDLIERGKWPIK